MSRRVPSGSVRGGSRAPSLAGSSRLARAGATSTDRRTTATGLTVTAGTRIPSAVPESSINVVVRCRGRSTQEIAEGSPVIMTTEGPLSKSITIETTPAAAAHAAAHNAGSLMTASGYGGATQPNTKTYNFDKVFGPEADQTMVFNEVADKLLDEVLAGYNCTIFAYGQTGTGKTHTMQGDVAPTPLLAPSTDAGIIPRVLHRLFKVLENQENTEFAVKCSYLELYNEELRDLLAPEYKDPAYASQIKIFDDQSKKGVVVQGLEEAGIRNLKDGLAILNRGSQRRQTAETKMNTESSRSHSIFTLTVHVKETSTAKGGEDLMRIGKFNLVDLAGSEAIGRSGAQDKRAREAGMINQSLLTLGRVISALVDKGSHIPYRESKLTRLLQDSLGGRTKTCIVATVSPTRSNMEETLSTLDYALRAKSIKNKPEVNAHLTKAGLLKEYVGDIERLKAELWAAREKNGIYIPEDQWREMNEDRARKTTGYKEAQQRVTAVEIELRTRKAEFEDLTSRFVTTTDDLAQTREAERQLGEALDAARADVEAMRVALDEERVVASAYEAGEERLHTVAADLRGVAVETTRDVGGLFDKLGRMASVLDTNTDSATHFGSQMAALSTDLKTGIKQLHTVQGEFGGTLRADLEAYARQGEEESQHRLGELDASLGAFSELAAALSGSVEGGASDTVAAANAVLQAKDDVQAAVRKWAAGVGKRSASMVDNLVAHQAEHLGVVGEVLNTATWLVDAVILAARNTLATQDDSLTRARTLAAQAADAEVARLRAQNAALVQLLADEQARSARLRTDLIERITATVTDFATERDASMRAVLGRAAADADGGVRELAAFADAHGRAVDDGQVAVRDLRQDLDRYEGDNSTQRTEASSALREASRGMRTQLEQYAADTGRQAEEHVDAVNTLCEEIGGRAEDLSRDAATRGQAQGDTLAALAQNARAGHALSTQRVQDGAKDIERLTSTLLRSHATSSETATKAYGSAKRKLAAMQDATQDFAANLAVDEPTGDTPRKRAYVFPQTWERTEPRAMLIAGMRRGVEGCGSRGSAASVASVSASGYVAAPTAEATTATTAAASSRRSSQDEAMSEDILDLKPVSSTTSLASLDDVERPLPHPHPHPTIERPPMSRSVSRELDRKVAPLSHGYVAHARPKRSKTGTLERERDPRAPMSVLGEGGNIPRRRRRE